MQGLRKLPLIVLPSLCLLAGLFLVLEHPSAEPPTSNQIQAAQHRFKIAEQLGPLWQKKVFPTMAEMIWEDDNKEKLHISYSLDFTLQRKAEQLLGQYRPDYGAIVAMEPRTGRILAISSVQRSGKEAESLALRGTYPAASLFKIVTAAAAIDRGGVEPETLISFNGGLYALSRRNVMNSRENRWTRRFSLKDAFAKSLNTAFARLTFEHLEPADLEDYSLRFAFNRRIPTDLPIGEGVTRIPAEEGFELAQIASGFNRVTQISPIHAVMMAAAIPAEGMIFAPSLVDEIRNDLGEVIYKSTPLAISQAMSLEATQKMRELMRQTVIKGTSRRSFRKMVRNRRYQDLEVGGKTGSLTGTNPRGKTDWFAGYAMGESGEEIAIAAVTVNIKKWQVKSSYLAQEMFRTHFQEERVTTRSEPAE